MKTYREDEKEPVSYKAFCQRTREKLCWFEMHFVYTVIYLPSFKEEV
jgi:hypothetical protein